MQSRWQPSHCTMLYLLSLWNKVELSQWSHSPERYFYHVNRASKALYPKYGRFSYGLVANRLQGKGEPHNTFTSEGLTLWFSRITHIDNVIYNSFTLLSTSEFTSLKLHLILSASFEFFSSVIKEYRNKTSECNLVKSAPPVSSEAMLAMRWPWACFNYCQTCKSTVSRSLEWTLAVSRGKTREDLREHDGDSLQQMILKLVGSQPPWGS